MLTQHLPLVYIGLTSALLCCRHDEETAGWLLRANAEKLYSEAFTTPFENIDLKASRGIAWHGHDAWILFTSESAVSLSSACRYREVDPSPYFPEFSAALSMSTVAAEHSLILRCLFFSDPTATYSNGKCLIFDDEQGLYFFHSWNHK